MGCEHADAASKSTVHTHRICSALRRRSRVEHRPEAEGATTKGATHPGAPAVTRAFPYHHDPYAPWR